MRACRRTRTPSHMGPGPGRTCAQGPRPPPSAPTRVGEGPGDLQAFTHVMERERATHRQVPGREGARSCPRHTSSHSLATRGVNCMRAPSILHVTGEAGGEDGRNWCSTGNESSGEDDPPLADPLTQIPDPAVPFVFPHVEKRCPHSLVVRGLCLGVCLARAPCPPDSVLCTPPPDSPWPLLRTTTPRAPSSCTTTSVVRRSAGDAPSQRRRGMPWTSTTTSGRQLRWTGALR